LYDFKAARVNSFDSFPTIYFYIFFAPNDTNRRKIARLLVKAEFFKPSAGYKKQAARVLLWYQTEYR